MQIDATEQPTPRSAEWLAGWASATTTARSQVDTLRAEVERCRIEKWCEETQVPRLAAELGTTRALLESAYYQLDPIYLDDGVTLHPGCVSTLHELYEYLWPEGKAK